MGHSKRKRKAAGLDTENSDPAKRQKIGGAIGNNTTNGAKVVRLDELNWKSVEVPETLDDYEGFFGLEEVDDVEVVRDTESGKISYVTKNAGGLKDQGTDSDHRNGALEDDEAGKSVIEQDDDDEESWEGFSDSLDAANGHGILKGSKDKAQANGKAPGGPVQEQDDPNELEDIPFTGLADLEEDDSADESVDVSWRPLNLSFETLGSLSKLKFSTPTPIQLKAIPPILSGSDVIGKAATGSGKTLAYGIPMLESYIHSKAHHKSRRESQPQDYNMLALILSPTRELAHQIAVHLTDLGKRAFDDWPRISIITGGLSIQKQQRQLQTADIVVGTPGRLWEVISAGGQTILSKLQRIKYLVVDEADRLLTEGHFAELSEILSALDRVDADDPNAVAKAQNLKSQRQVLVFSATFDRSLRSKLVSKKSHPLRDDPMSRTESLSYLLQKLPFRTNKPMFIDVDPTSHLAPNIRSSLLEIPTASEKDLYLYTLLLLSGKNKRVLIFTNSVSSIRHLTSLLGLLALPAQGLHSNMEQKARLRTVERFRRDEGAVLVATDVAARGLDIPGVETVVHYHVPRSADSYVHRAGRTARAGEKGGNVVLCSSGEAKAFARLVRAVHEGAELRTLELDGRVVRGLRERVGLAKRIAEVQGAKQKAATKTEELFVRAAEDLGVEVDSEEMDAADSGRRGRGNARKKRERQDRGVGKEQIGAWKADLKSLLNQRVNVGVSEKYLTSGSIDIDALLRGEMGEFLGSVKELELTGED